MRASPVVATRAGNVRGTFDEDIEVFRGVPYGASTAGENRFRPPQPRSPWTGELDATAYGPSCPQTPIYAGGSTELAQTIGHTESEAVAQSEDCLVLNVWTPRSGDGGRRPVMVWLHGGAFTAGSGSLPHNRGTRLAARGDVVVVTVNHRLGPFGFLELAELGGPEYADSGNVGMLDIVDALQWVHDEIESFGGDPDNVTVFGFSGGGGKVSTLLGMPAARGLFRRAIVQSGPLLRALPIERATGTARDVLGALGLGPSDMKALLDLPPAALLDAVSATMPSMLTGVTSGELARGQHALQLSPVVDGRVLPADPFDPTAAPSADGVPLIIGTTTFESALFAAMAPGFDTLDADGYLGIVRAIAGDLSAEMLAAYRQTRPDATPSDLALAAMTGPFWTAAIALAERKTAASTAPVFMYLFAYETDAYGGRLKSGHGVDVPFIFDVVDELPFTGSWDGRRRLAGAISDAWIAFARTGDPNHSGLPSWPTYDTATRATMVFDRECRVESDPQGEERRVWAKAPLHF